MKHGPDYQSETLHVVGLDSVILLQNGPVVQATHMEEFCRHKVLRQTELPNFVYQGTEVVLEEIFYGLEVRVTDFLDV